MPTRFQVVMDCADPDRLARFWSVALGYVIPDPPDGHATWEDFLRSAGVPESEWGAASAVEAPPDEAGPAFPRIYFQRVPETKVVKNRVHLDLNVGGGRSVPLEERRRRVDAEVGRLKGLGASDARGAMEKDDEYWVRMQDPEGNEFCVQ
jgi:hypothetical protein